MAFYLSICQAKRHRSRLDFAAHLIEIEQLALPLGEQAAKSLLVPYAESPTALAGASR
jgi:hypothetical protein